MIWKLESKNERQYPKAFPQTCAWGHVRPVLLQSTEDIMPNMI